MVPTIPSDSYVLIRRQPVVEDGEIAPVIVNGDSEATLKRVKHVNDVVMLMPDNNDYHPYSLIGCGNTQKETVALLIQNVLDSMTEDERRKFNVQYQVLEDKTIKQAKKSKAK